MNFKLKMLTFNWVKQAYKEIFITQVTSWITKASKNSTLFYFSTAWSGSLKTVTITNAESMVSSTSLETWVVSHKPLFWFLHLFSFRFRNISLRLWHLSYCFMQGRRLKGCLRKLRMKKGWSIFHSWIPWKQIKKLNKTTTSYIWAKLTASDYSSAISLVNYSVSDIGKREISFQNYIKLARKELNRSWTSLKWWTIDEILKFCWKIQ